MPEIRYTLQVEEDVFKEKEIVRRTKDTAELIALVAKEIVHPLQDKRRKLGEPELSLLHVEVLNPHIHQHEWHRTHINRSSLRAIYICRECDVMGWKPYHTVFGETSQTVTRDDAFKNEKFAVCRDPLKEAPKKLSFI